MSEFNFSGQQPSSFFHGNQDNNQSNDSLVPKIHILDILKYKHIRVFCYDDKYVLVNSEDNAFMIFQIINNTESDTLIPTICHIQYTFSMHVSKLPNAKLVQFSDISIPNLKYMTQVYLRHYALSVQARALEDRYNLSIKFAQYVIDVAKYRVEMIDLVCTDIVEARYYLNNNKSKTDWRNSLSEGSNSEKLEILHELLSEEAFLALKIHKIGKKILTMIINEILN